jgi:hypothetical protein
MEAAVDIGDLDGPVTHQTRDRGIGAADTDYDGGRPLLCEQRRQMEDGSSADEQSKGVWFHVVLPLAD